MRRGERRKGLQKIWKNDDKKTDEMDRKECRKMMKTNKGRRWKMKKNVGWGVCMKQFICGARPPTTLFPPPPLACPESEVLPWLLNIHTGRRSELGATKVRRPPNSALACLDLGAAKQISQALSMVQPETNGRCKSTCFLSTGQQKKEHLPCGFVAAKKDTETSGFLPPTHAQCRPKRRTALQAVAGSCIKRKKKKEEKEKKTNGKLLAGEGDEIAGFPQAPPFKAERNQTKMRPKKKSPPPRPCPRLTQERQRVRDHLQP